MTAPFDLTLIVPTVSRPALFARALESALGQDFDGRLQVIASLNGAGEATHRALERHVGNPRLQVFTHAQTIPTFDHFNFLRDRIAGKFCVFLSDDDWLEPDFAAAAMRYFETNPDVAFLVCGCLMHYEQLARPALLGPPRQDGVHFLAEWVSGRRHVCFCATVFPTEKLRALGPLPNDIIFGDMYFWVRLACAGDVGSLDRPLSHYTVMMSGHQGESTMSDIRAWGEETAGLLRLAVDRVHLENAPDIDSAAVERHADDYVARTIALQFVLKACAGISKSRLWRQARWAVRHLRGSSPRNWLAFGAALTLPSRLVSALFRYALQRDRQH